jgi:hypothetical protein
MNSNLEEKYRRPDNIDRQHEIVRACAYRKLNPGVLMVQTSKNWAGNDAPSLRDSACDRRVLVQG